MRIERGLDGLEFIVFKDELEAFTFATKHDTPIYCFDGYMNAIWVGDITHKVHADYSFTGVCGCAVCQLRREKCTFRTGIVG